MRVTDESVGWPERNVGRRHVTSIRGERQTTEPIVGRDVAGLVLGDESVDDGAGRRGSVEFALHAEERLIRTVGGGAEVDDAHFGVTLLDLPGERVGIGEPVAVGDRAADEDVARGRSRARSARRAAMIREVGDEA
jgi:hypothetical protein